MSDPVLVPFASHHVPHRVAWLSDKRLRRAVPIMGELTVSSTLEWHQRVAGASSRADFVLEDGTGRPRIMCGITGIDQDAGRGELYMFGDPDGHGRGYGSAALDLLSKWAFEQRGLNRVFLYTMGSNASARRFYERGGFKEEGCLKEHVKHEGVIEDRYIHALMRTEWEAGAHG